MANKTEMVSVPRELLERLAYGQWECPSLKDREDIRALLLAPISCRACAGTGGFDRMETCEVCKGKGRLPSPTVAPAEDVRAVVEEPAGYFTFCCDKNKWIHGKPKMPEFIHLFTPLYRHPQRPVVLPERVAVPAQIAGLGRKYAEGYNACLDEIERLNK